MGYQKVFNKPYEEGYKNLPDKSTPVTAEILNMQDDTFSNVEDYLENLTYGMPTDSFIELLQEYVPQVNPATTGDEPILTGLSVGEAVYRIPSSSTAEETSYVPNGILASTNVQSAIDTIVGAGDSVVSYRIKTGSNGGTNASIIVTCPEKMINDTIGYKSVQSTPKIYDLFSVQYRGESGGWTITALDKCVYDGRVYEAGEVVKVWLYSVVVDFSVSELPKPLFAFYEEGKGLSTNDFTDEYKHELDGVTHTTTEKTIEDASDGNIVALSLVGNTTQGANPSPSNPQPINGFDGEMGTHGKNLLNCSGLTTQTINGVTFTPKYNANGLLEYINVNGTCTSNADYWFSSGQAGKFVNTNYIFSCLPQTVDGLSISYVEDGGSYVVAGIGDKNLQNKGFRGGYIHVVSGKTINNVTVYPMIRLATETDATYEPYQSSTIHTFPLYSIGDIKDELRVYSDGSGEYTKRIGSVDLGDLSYTYDSRLFFMGSVPNGKKDIGLNVVYKMLCEIYVPYKSIYGNDFPSAPNNIVCWDRSSSSIMIKDTSFTDVDSFKERIKGSKFIYELEVPTTHTLTPSEVAEILKLKTYRGKTYIDAENVDFNLEYFADSEIGQSLADIKSTFLNLLLQPTPTNSEQE